MDLRVARVRKAGTPLVSAPARRHVRTARIRGEIEHVAVTTGSEHDCVRTVPGDLTRLQIANDDSLGVTVHDHEIQHLGVRVRFHPTVGDVAVQRRISTQQQLLTRLAACIKRAAHLRTTEGAVIEQPAVFTGKRHTLRRALIDDVHGHLGQTMHVRLARTEVTTLDGVVEKTTHGVAIVLVILRGIDAALRRHRVRAPGRIVKHEVMHFVTQLSQRGGSGGAGQTGTDDDDLVFPLVRRIDQLAVELVALPLLGERAGRDVGLQFLVQRHGWNVMI
ncbi:MAG: hypothetical protein K0Q55_685 [Verrucomicrobia bacterium]|nr:hypothetical protein [Verrucomicrobiota bacterium]